MSDESRTLAVMQARHTRELTALLEFSKGLLGHHSVDGLTRHLVEEVRRFLRADACAILLPDATGRRIEFRAASGWRHDPVAPKHTVSADEHSGPGRVMLTQQPLIIEDAVADPRGIFIPHWMAAEDFRGHWVIPLLAEGQAIGALAVDFRRPQPAAEDDIRLLQLMGTQAALALETARLQEEALRQERLAEQLQVARQIQLSLLPDDAPEVPGWDFAAAYRPAQTVGGDFYDYFYLPGPPLRMGVVIADVADKGVPAALYMALSRTVIRTSALGGRRPAAVLLRANTIIREDSKSDMFLTACYATFDLGSGRMVIANAGHNRPLLWRSNAGDGSELRTRGMILGAFEDITIEERETVLDLGDALLLYSDGVTDATSAQGKTFGEERLRLVLVANAERGAQALIEAILAAIDEFTGGAAQYDDMTLVAVRRLPTLPDEAIPVDWTHASFPSQRMPAYVRRRAV
jgi:sigma-B regulation protein RsbU (phosphoserine phosphatase)